MLRGATIGWLKRIVESYAIISYRLEKSLGLKSTLTTIANYHASDKGTLHGYAAGLFPGHGYTRLYEHLFRDLRAETAALLEIGIGVEGPGAIGTTVFGRNRGGASLKTWYEFFPRFQIYGIDVNSAHFLDNDRIRTFIGNQASRAHLHTIMDQIGEPLTIVIDDGSHASKHQQISLAALFPHVANGGTYLIEDLDFQPDSVGSSDDLKTLSLLEVFISTGDFPSPFISGEEREYLRTHVSECSIERTEAGIAVLGILRKK